MSTENSNANAAGTEKLSIFSIGANKEQMDASMFREKFDNPLFDPKVKKAGDTLVFIIRAMPFIGNPLKSMIAKNYYALRDATGVIMFDSRTTFNRPAENHWEFCPPSDVWLKLRGAKDPNVKARAGWIRQQRANYCYVQIIAFPEDPSFNGKIMPMRIPVEMVKLFDAMSKPSEQDLALGTKPIQPFDILSSKNIKCTVTGFMQDEVLMRNWKTVLDGELCEAKFPLGPNGAMTPVTKLKQEDVIKYFQEQESIDLEEAYGYKEPTIEAKRRMKALLQAWTNDIPGLPNIVAGYFPELANQLPLEQNAAEPSVFNMGQPLPNPIQAGNPMNTVQTTVPPIPPATPIPTATPIPPATPPTPPAPTGTEAAGIKLP